MMPEETAQAHLDLRGQVLIPIPWGTFKLALHSWTKPVKRLVAKARDLGIPLPPGETGDFSGNRTETMFIVLCRY